MIQRKTLSAVVLILAFALIIAGCGVAGVSQAPEFTPTPTKTPKPTFTPTPEATATPVPTDTPEATATPVPTDTPAATDTPEATNTPTVAPTNTPRPRPTNPPPPPPTNTPAPPPPTATPQNQYTGEFVQWEPNCAGTQVKGTVFEVNGQPKPGVTVRVLVFGQQFGDLPRSNNDGFYEFNRFGTPDGLLPVAYDVAVVRAETGEVLSNVVSVKTNQEDCDQGGSGHQVATINFRKNY